MPSSHDAIAEISAGCLAVRVRMLGRAVSAIYDRALAPRGLTIAQMNILVFVGLRGPCAPALIGRVLQMEKSTVSRNLRPMLELGWLASDAVGGERVLDVRLTARGRQRVESALPLWRLAQAEAEALLGVTGTQALRALGQRLWGGAGI